MSLKERFNDLDPKQKKIVIWSGIGVIFMILVSTGYNASQTDTSEGFFGQKNTREIQLEPDLIQKTMLREQRRQLESLQEAVDKISTGTKEIGTDQPLKKCFLKSPLQTRLQEQTTLPSITA